jgi:RNA polymerase sigma factor (TIGR02999 family)
MPAGILRSRFAAYDILAMASTPTTGEVTRLLSQLRGGDHDALDRLFPLVYQELRRAAERALRREAGGHTLQPTALVHEAYLKLAGGPLESANRAHFLGIVARAMRQVLVDHARRRRAAKRGGGEAAMSLSEADGAWTVRPDELVGLDEALDRLGARNDRLRRVVELRFFGGLTEDETAVALGVTTRTVQRDWAKARAWLHKELAGQPDPDA